MFVLNLSLKTTWAEKNVPNEPTEEQEHFSVCETSLSKQLTPTYTEV